MPATDPQKKIVWLLRLCIVIGWAAVAVGVLALWREQASIAVAMFFVALVQVINYRLWKKKRK